jgi:hypothetical protein
MDGFLQGAGTVGLWSAAILWTIALVGACAAVLLALPGGWVALGLAVLWDAFHGFHSIGPLRLGIFAGLLLIAEAIEALLGSVWVARKGATIWGVVGTFLGGIGGVAVGTGLLPVIGTLVGAVVGAFAGAVAGEYLRDRRLEPSLRLGLHATLGRLAAVLVKGVLATAGAALVAAEAWRQLIGRGS